MKAGIVAGIGMLITLGLVAGAGNGTPPELTYEITFTNITHGVDLTPPIFALSENQIDVFEAGTPASAALELLAEGGATGDLRTEWENIGVQDVMETMVLVEPGQSISLQLTGNRKSRLNLASMLLPTNDGFVATNGPRVASRSGETEFYLPAYDAGTELNEETCATIPGPDCGGEGYNMAGGEGHVVPHAGIHGEGELSRRAHNWSDPVAKVTVRIVN